MSADTPSGAPVVELDVPWPPRELSPNYRPRTGNANAQGRRWTDRAQAAGIYKEDCRKLARSAMAISPLAFPLAAPVFVTVTFVMRRWMRRDGDNLVASIKAAIDGLVVAHLIEDDSFKVLRPILIDAETGPVQQVRFRLEGAVK